MKTALRVGMLLGAGWLLAGAAPGCGGTSIGNKTASCDFRQGSVNGPEARCQERVNTIDADTFKTTCDALKGKSAEGPCPRANVIGGCQIGTQGDGSKVNDWYYTADTCPGCTTSPKSVDDVKHECGSSPFLNP